MARDLIVGVDLGQRSAARGDFLLEGRLLVGGSIPLNWPDGPNRVLLTIAAGLV